MEMKQKSYVLHLNGWGDAEQNSSHALLSKLMPTPNWKASVQRHFRIEGFSGGDMDRLEETRDQVASPESVPMSSPSWLIEELYRQIPQWQLEDEDPSEGKAALAAMAAGEFNQHPRLGAPSPQNEHAAEQDVFLAEKEHPSRIRYAVRMKIA